MNREERPWGWFETIEENEAYKFKKIFVNPNQQFSLQYHNHREEHWIIIEGSGFMTLDKSCFPVYFGDSFKVETKQIHRMKAGPKGILFYEVQIGDQCKESDIKRLEDDYGRIE
jgi:mannose-6-phosphate isomerase-like protein (cupin superfamily)